MFTHAEREGATVCHPAFQVIHPAIDAVAMAANVIQDKHLLTETDVAGSAGIRLTGTRQLETTTPSN
jgi:hypothetical protein